DENYFDKVLPYAIVFNMADKWKDKLKDLEVPPPKWYSGYYAGNTFNTMMFMNSLDHSINQMTNTFYSSPGSSGSSGAVSAVAVDFREVVLVGEEEAAGKILYQTLLLLFFLKNKDCHYLFLY
ncbi:MAG TPA: hypothetical protein VFU62_08355, partial [Hanamia sp.]|nr:hypothetical protein [Hanamia sp.]